MKHTLKNNTVYKDETGFTLIELSVVIIIIGIMMIPLLDGIDRYMTQRKVIYTQNIISAASDMIVEFRANEIIDPLSGFDYVYPCPAKRTLSRTDSEFGISIDCSDLASYGLNAPGDCAFGICITVNAGVDNDDIAGDDWIVVGGLPSMTMLNAAADGLDYRTSDMFSTRMDIDGWNNQLTYAVAHSLTRDDTDDKFWWGAIGAVDEFNQNTAGMANDAHFAVVSHGKNKRGAYNAEGIITVPCDTVAPQNANGDNENCDDDGIFRQALGRYDSGNAAAYDDYIRFAKETNLSIWESTTAAQGDQMYFAPTGNLGINFDAVTTPATTLEVSGNVLVNNNILVENICDTDGNCFDTEIISGDSLNCGNNELLKAISLGVKVCEVPSFDYSGGKLQTLDCSGVGNGYIRGFKTNGEVICY